MVIAIQSLQPFLLSRLANFISHGTVLLTIQVAKLKQYCNLTIQLELLLKYAIKEVDSQRLLQLLNDSTQNPDKSQATKHKIFSQLSGILYIAYLLHRIIKAFNALPHWDFSHISPSNQLSARTSSPVVCVMNLYKQKDYRFKHCEESFEFQEFLINQNSFSIQSLL